MTSSEIMSICSEYVKDNPEIYENGDTFLTSPVETLIRAISKINTPDADEGLSENCKLLVLSYRYVGDDLHYGFLRSNIRTIEATGLIHYIGNLLINE